VVQVKFETLNNKMDEIIAINESTENKSTEKINEFIRSWDIKMIELMIAAYPSPNMSIYNFEPITQNNTLCSVLNNNSILGSNTKYTN